MKHAVAWLVTLVLSVAQPVIVQAGDTQMSQDHQAVQSVIDSMTTAFMAGDIDTVMQSYETGAAVMFEPNVPVQGSAQLREMFSMSASMKPSFTFADHEIFVAGDIAMHLSPWTMQATGPDGSDIEQSGLSVAVLRKQADGSWKMVLDNPHGQFLLSQ